MIPNSLNSNCIQASFGLTLTQEFYLLENRLPRTLQPLITTYLEEVKLLDYKFYGIYIYGSIALGAFRETDSDIDIVALTLGEWTADELNRLENVHRQLAKKDPLARRLEIIYLPHHALEKQSEQIPPYPRFRDGKFLPASHGDFNAVTAWLIKHKGIHLAGPEPGRLRLVVTWEDVLQAMDYNLNHYWANKARKQPYLFVSDYWVNFGVTTLCRILTTLEDGEIIGKDAALARWRDRLPARFQPLIDETCRLRGQLQISSPYRFRFKRVLDTWAFINYVRERTKPY
jgi:predicted nucleotidyltransferase